MHQSHFSGTFGLGIKKHSQCSFMEGLFKSSRVIVMRYEYHDILYRFIERLYKISVCMWRTLVQIDLVDVAFVLCTINMICMFSMLKVVVLLQMCLCDDQLSRWICWGWCVQHGFAPSFTHWPSLLTPLQLAVSLKESLSLGDVVAPKNAKGYQPLIFGI